MLEDEKEMNSSIEIMTPTVEESTDAYLPPKLRVSRQVAISDEQLFDTNRQHASSDPEIGQLQEQLDSDEEDADFRDNSTEFDEEEVLFACTISTVFCNIFFLFKKNIKNVLADFLCSDIVYNLFLVYHLATLCTRSLQLSSIFGIGIVYLCWGPD